MKKVQILKDYKSMSDPVFEVKVNFIVSAMTANKHLPKPSPTLTALQTTNKKYADLLMKANDGGRTASTAKKNQRLEVTAMLDSLGNYVEYTQYLILSSIHNNQ